MSGALAQDPAERVTGERAVLLPPLSRPTRSLTLAGGGGTVYRTFRAEGTEGFASRSFRVGLRVPVGRWSANVDLESDAAFGRFFADGFVRGDAALSAFRLLLEGPAGWRVRAGRTRTELDLGGGFVGGALPGIGTDPPTAYRGDASILGVGWSRPGPITIGADASFVRRDARVEARGGDRFLRLPADASGHVLALSAESGPPGGRVDLAYSRSRLAGSGAISRETGAVGAGSARAESERIALRYRRRRGSSELAFAVERATFSERLDGRAPDAGLLGIDAPFVGAGIYAAEAGLTRTEIGAGWERGYRRGSLGFALRLGEYQPRASGTVRLRDGFLQIGSSFSLREETARLATLEIRYRRTVGPIDLSFEARQFVPLSFSGGGGGGGGGARERSEGGWNLGVAATIRF